VALPDDLQLHRRLPARDPRHPGDPRGFEPDRGAAGLSEAPLRRYPHLVIRTDGAARGNPGPASLGAVLIDGSRPDALDPAARPDATLSEALGRATNNVAEWTGVVRALELAVRFGAERVDLFLDSNLIVEQLHGRWKVKDAKLQPLWAEARAILAGFRRWSATHVPRAQNAAADALANEALDRVAAGGPARVARARRSSD
jgi:ribonuclease HI